MVESRAEPAAAAEPLGRAESDHCAAHRCSICMTERLVEPACITDCGHSFCLACIKEWSRTRLEPRCPLCNGQMTAVSYAGIEEAVQPLQQQRVEEDLGCLDHAYFQAETERLLCRAQASQNAVFRDAYGSGRQGSRQYDEALEALQDVITSLRSYRTSMDEEVPFEPTQVLQELYSLDHIVQSVQAGTWARDTAAHRGARLYSADDADECMEDEEDDYGYDYGYHAAAHPPVGAVASTPGRRPPHRNDRRSSGNGSGRRQRGGRRTPQAS
ncbi:hypothetical protein WJX72_005560 [[Myrmecia] bisecta]|uniref:RING-type domain-containing protein n=1 Tax=[Myrmecia] bisecta TaxID=41462 RepID=A0AAW1P4L4_9CHLO